MAYSKMIDRINYLRSHPNLGALSGQETHPFLHRQGSSRIALIRRLYHLAQLREPLFVVLCKFAS